MLKSRTVANLLEINSFQMIHFADTHMNENNNGDVISSVPKLIKYKQHEPVVILIDSRRRNTNSNSTSDFTQSIQATAVRVKDFWIQNIVIPHSMYNIETGVNDTFVVEVTGTGIDTTVVIPAGYYIGSTLASAIATALGGAYTCSFSAITGKLTVGNSTAFKVKPASNLAFPSYATGFITNSTAFATSQVSQQLCQLGASSQQIFIAITVGTQSLNRPIYLPTNTGGSNVVNAAFQILNDVDFGAYIKATPDALVASLNTTTDAGIASVKVQLFNENNKIINLNGVDVQITLHAY